jgi:hypothetical protein
VLSFRRCMVECLFKPHHASHYTNSTLTRPSYGLDTSRPPSRLRHDGKSPSLLSNPSAFSRQSSVSSLSPSLRLRLRLRLHPFRPREARTQIAALGKQESDKAGASSGLVVDPFRFRNNVIYSVKPLRAGLPHPHDITLRPTYRPSLFRKHTRQ